MLGNPINEPPVSLPDFCYWCTSKGDPYAQFPPLQNNYVWDAAHTYADIRFSLPLGEISDGVPKTGDAATRVLWHGLMLLAGAGLR